MMNASLLTVTSLTWQVTFLGFGVVFLLLLIFVYVVIAMGLFFHPKQQKKNLNTTHLNNNKKNTNNELTYIAIATTIYLYQNNKNVHDVEPTKITYSAHPTEWNNKFFGMNNLHR